MDKVFDCIIVGSGPAGLSAFVYFLMAKKNVLCFDKSAPGGKLNEIPKIKNYPFESDITGPQLSLKLYNHILSLGGKVLTEEIMGICRENSLFLVTTNQGKYLTNNIIISIGTKTGNFGYKGEEKFVGKGVSYCATCDGFFFRKNPVCVIGNTKEAFESALYLSDLCSQVTLLVKGDTEDLKLFKEDLLTRSNISIVNDYSDVELTGETILENVVIDGVPLESKGCFIFGDSKPSNAFYKSLNLEESNGYIKIDERMETSVKGIYAAGDCVSKKIRQIINASSEGMTAALSVISSINSNRK